MDRVISRPLFDGPVEFGKSYVLIDDATVLGGTLAELANHIQEGGGKVVGLAVLANASRAGLLSPATTHVTLAERRFGNVLRNEIGVEPGALTGPEAGYLAGFKDADALRARIAKAKRERSERLRAKSIRPSEDESGLDQPGATRLA